MNIIGELHIYKAFRNNPNSNDVLNGKLKYNSSVLFNCITELEATSKHLTVGQCHQVGVW